MSKRKNLNPKHFYKTYGMYEKYAVKLWIVLVFLWSITCSGTRSNVVRDNLNNDESLAQSPLVKDDTKYQLPTIEEESLLQKPLTEEESFLVKTLVETESLSQVPNIEEESLSQVPKIEEKSFFEKTLMQEELLSHLHTIEEESLSQVPEIEEESFLEKTLVETESLSQVPTIEEESLSRAHIIEEQTLLRESKIEKETFLLETPFTNISLLENQNKDKPLLQHSSEQKFQQSVSNELHLFQNLSEEETLTQNPSLGKSRQDLNEKCDQQHSCEIDLKLNLCEESFLQDSCEEDSQQDSSEKKYEKILNANWDGEESNKQEETVIKITKDNSLLEFKKIKKTLIKIKKTFKIYKDPKPFYISAEINNEINYEINLDDILLHYQFKTLIENNFDQLLKLNNWSIPESKCFKFYYEFKLGIFYCEYVQKWLENKRKYKGCNDNKKAINAKFQHIIKEDIVKFVKNLYYFDNMYYEIVSDDVIYKNRSFDVYNFMEKLTINDTEIEKKFCFDDNGYRFDSFEFSTSEQDANLLFAKVPTCDILDCFVDVGNNLSCSKQKSNNDKWLQINFGNILSAYIKYYRKNKSNNIVYYVFPSKKRILEKVCVDSCSDFRSFFERSLCSFRFNHFDDEFRVFYSAMCSSFAYCYFKSINDAYETVLSDLKSKVSFLKNKEGNISNKNNYIIINGTGDDIRIKLESENNDTSLKQNIENNNDKLSNDLIKEVNLNSDEETSNSIPEKIDNKLEDLYECEKSCGDKNNITNIECASSNSEKIRDNELINKTDQLSDHALK